MFFDGLLPDPAPLPEAVQGVAGAWAEFRGYVRGEENGKPIAALRYEIYAAMARHRLETHLDELAGRFPLCAARFWHRSGVVRVGEASVYAAVAAPHRSDAFAALAELMNRLKSDVPIWKVEALPV